MTRDKLAALGLVLALVAVPTLLLPGWLLSQAHWIGPLSTALIALAGLYSLSMVLLAVWYELTEPDNTDAIERANTLRSFSSLLPNGLLLALTVGSILRAALTFAPVLAD